MWSETRVNLRSLQSCRLHSKEAHVIPGPVLLSIQKRTNNCYCQGEYERLGVGQDSALKCNPRSTERERIFLDHTLDALEVESS